MSDTWSQRPDRDQTFETSKSIGVAIFTRHSFVDPAWVAKKGRVLLIGDVKRYERMKVIYLEGQRRICASKFIFVLVGELSYSVGFAEWQQICAASLHAYYR